MTVMEAMRLRAMARKEWIQLKRDRRSMVLAFVLPVFLLLFFGYAISWDIDDLPLGVLDQNNTSDSRALVDALTAGGYFRVAERIGDYDAIDAHLQEGTVRAVLVIPPDYGAELGARRGAPVQLLLDGGDANTATIALNYADAIVATHARDIAFEGRVIEPPLRVDSRVWYNPTLESRNMIVPALIAVIMSIIAAMLTALTIAREWERGTMEQLASTPVHRLEVVVGKLLPYVAIGLVDVTVAVLAGIVVFGVPFRGSVLLLGMMTLLFLIGALGLGIFISAALRSQVLAMQVAMVATYLPALLLSGFLFDIAAMPVALRAITTIVPARYYVTVTRGIFLKGVGLEALWPQALAMIAFATAGLGAAALAFRKQIAR